MKAQLGRRKSTFTSSLSPGPVWIYAGPGLLAWDLFFFKPFVKQEEMAYHSCIGPGVES